MRRRLYMCVFCRARSLVVWLFQVLLFCRHLFFICDPACAVVLRMSSVTPQKRKRCVLSIKQKLEICDRSRNDWSYSQISAEYGIGKSTVFDIIKSEDKLKTFQSQLPNEDCMKKGCIVRTADFPDVDKVVFLWFVQEWALGVPASGPALMAKAALMYRKLHPEDGTCEKFKAETGMYTCTGVHVIDSQL